MDPNDWRYQLLGALTTGLVAVITACVPLVVRAAVQYLQKLTHVTVSEAQEHALEAAASQAVAWVEEQARKRAKAEGAPWPSDQKMLAAKAMVRDVLARQGHVGLLNLAAETTLERAIESQLAQQRPFVPVLRDPPT